MSDTAPLARFTVALLAKGEVDVAAYLGVRGTQPDSGASFERYGVNDPYRITGDDLVATTMLSIRFGAMRKGLSGWAPEHAIAVERMAGRISDLLHQVPAGAELSTLDEAEAHHLLAWESGTTPGRQLYSLVRHGLGTAHAPGRVAVYKLLARKRPGLFAIRDSVVEKLVGHVTPDSWWMPWWRTLQERPDITSRLREIQESIPEPLRPTLLRTADMALWMRGRQEHAS